MRFEKRLKRTIRFALLAVYYFHPAVLFVALRRGPRAAAVYMKEIYRASKLNAGAYVPSIPVEAIVNAPADFRIFRPDTWHCSMSVPEISALCYLVAYKRPRKVLEIGTFRGLTTLNLALNAPDAEVHTVDITDTWGSYYYEDFPNVKNIKQHYGDTNEFDFVREIGYGVEFCLIDGGHSYEQVRNDTLKALVIMKEDGFLLWDDYGKNDFITELESFRVSHFIHDIKNAGVRVLHGTGLAFLQVTRAARQELQTILDRYGSRRVMSFSETSAAKPRV